MICVNFIIIIVIIVCEKNGMPYFRTAPPMSCNVAFSHGGDFSDYVLPVCDSVKCRGWLPAFWRGLKKSCRYIMTY
jgi:hypothetical protein